MCIYMFLIVSIAAKALVAAKFDQNLGMNDNLIIVSRTVSCNLCYNILIDACAFYLRSPCSLSHYSSSLRITNFIIFFCFITRMCFPTNLCLIIQASTIHVQPTMTTKSGDIVRQELQYMATNPIHYKTLYNLVQTDIFCSKAVDSITTNKYQNGA